MKLPEISIKYHQFTNIIVLLLILTGISSYLSMPRSEDPLIQPPGGSVIAVYPGASPADIEEIIIEPVEEAVNELEDVRYIEGHAEDGIGIVGVEFEPGVDIEEKYSDLVEKINSIRQELPQELLSLEMMKWTITGVKIFQIGLISENAEYYHLEEEAERLKDELETIWGLKKVEISAVPERIVQVSVDLEKLALLKIPLSSVMNIIRDANANIPGGYIDMGSKRMNIKTTGSYTSLEEIRNTIIHSKGGNPVYLKDVADISFSYKDPVHTARVNGERSIFVTVTQKENTNIIHISEDIEAAVDRFESTLSGDIILKTVFNQSEGVSSRVSGFFSNLLQGIILVGIVIFSAVSWRAAIIVMTVIPVSILMGIFGLDLSNYGLQQISIAGFVIALGLLVDNAIVVTDNIARYMRKGFSREEAAVKGTSEVGTAVVSATATTIFAFIPIILIQSMTGDFIRSMPVTVVYTLAASLLLSLSFTPYLSSKFLKVNHNKKQHNLRNLLNKFVNRYYQNILKKSLVKKWMVVIIAFVVLLISLTLIPFIGVSLFPKAEKPMFFINVNLPTGTNFRTTDQVTREVEMYLNTINDIEYYVANVGHGNPRLYYNMFPERNNSSYAQFYIKLKEFDKNRIAELISKIRQRFRYFPGAKINVKELEQGHVVEAPVAIRVLGKNMEILKKIAGDVEEIIASQDGAVNVNNPLDVSRTDLYVHVDRVRAKMAGLSLYEIDQTIRAAVNGMQVSTFRNEDGKEYKIIVRLPFRDKISNEDFDKIYISNLEGNAIPLKQVAQIEFTESEERIDHFQMERSVTVTADVMRNYSVNTITEKVIEELQEYNWPKGYRYYISGEKESRTEAFGGMQKAIIIAALVIFGVLVLQFRSYIQPFIIFTSVPLAIIGSLWALFITGNTFSFTAFVGFTSLVGIVVNNAIILIDYTNRLRREGRNITDALVTAGKTRFVPIILTTMTTIGGLLPLTLIGGPVWAPMGWTIIGGLLCSTFLTLVIVPVMYKIVIRE